MLQEKQMKCLVIGSARSGTTQTAKIISSHKKLKGKFSNEKILWSYLKNRNISCEEIVKIAEHLFDSFEVAKELMIDSQIFKCMRDYFFSKDNIVVVRTLRKNKLQHAMSLCLARQTGYWSCERKKEYWQKEIDALNLNSLEEAIQNFSIENSILDKELEKVNHIVIEYDNFYFGSLGYKYSLLKTIFENLNLDFQYNNKFDNLFKKGKLNTLDVYKKIPNIDEIDKKFSNNQNGFLFENLS